MLIIGPALLPTPPPSRKNLVFVRYTTPAPQNIKFLFGGSEVEVCVRGGRQCCVRWYDFLCRWFLFSGIFCARLIRLHPTRRIQNVASAYIYLFPSYFPNARTRPQKPIWSLTRNTAHNWCYSLLQAWQTLKQERTQLSRLFWRSHRLDLWLVGVLSVVVSRSKRDSQSH